MPLKQEQQDHQKLVVKRGRPKGARTGRVEVDALEEVIKKEKEIPPVPGAAQYSGNCP